MSPGRRLQLCFLALLLSACSSPRPAVVSQPASPIPPAGSALEPAALLPTGTPTRAPTRAPAITPVLPTTTVPPTVAPPFVICSPLGMHPLAELPQVISDPYKPPPPNRPEERHHGVDYGYWHYGERDSMSGEPVQAILPGTVAAVLDDQYPYGNMLLVETPRASLPASLIQQLQIEEGASLYHLYAHLLDPPDFEIDDPVEACQQVGEVGESGNTDIPHLHLETRLGPSGQVFESMLFYSTLATQEQMDNYVRWRSGGEFRHFDPMRLLSIRNPDS